MNFILVGVLAPLAYILLRLFIKSIVMMMLRNFQNNSEIKEMVECSSCGVFLQQREAVKKTDKFFCNKKSCIKNV